MHFSVIKLYSAGTNLLQKRLYPLDGSTYFNAYREIESIAGWKVGFNCNKREHVYL